MTETAADPPDIGRFRSGVRSKAHGFFRSPNSTRNNPSTPGSIPGASSTGSAPAVKSEKSLSGASQRSNSNSNSIAAATAATVIAASSHNGGLVTTTVSSNDTTAVSTLAGSTSLSSNDAVHRQEKPSASAAVAAARGTYPSATAAPPSGEGTVVDAAGAGAGEGDPASRKRTPGDLFREILHTFKIVILHSWINWLLVFVPVGIIVKFVPGVHPGVIFAMNCIAIVPLAGLLSHATETVARKMGDAIGALLNITFGNAVELIIFIIALAKNEIRIVQASLLGSILANLLLILGMGFFLGGLRYREQIYNSTVTQMSACLLSLSVISLVLPTAFHASFSSAALADAKSLTISRGTSVILLLVYGVYLLFQLKSHAYMYESTPQHIVDAESQPGPAANWLDSSDSDDSTSSSSDSDGSNHSRDTMRKRMKKVLRAGRRRKSSIASVDSDMLPHMSTRTPSFGTSNVSPLHDDRDSEEPIGRPHFPHFTTGEGSEEVIEEDRPHRYYRRSRRRRHGKHKKNKNRSQQDLDGETLQSTISEQPEPPTAERAEGEPRRVDFAVPGSSGGTDGGALEQTQSTTATARRNFPGLRGVSVRELVTPTVFAQRVEPANMPAVPAGPVPRVRYGIRRTNSLPDRLNQLNQYAARPPGAMFPAQMPLAALAGAAGAAGGHSKQKHGEEEEEEHISRTAAVLLLLVSTALVAVCAEFLVDSINDVVHSSPVGEIFIGLIILPIVGNAAEHVTAITVAMKNKMDLAIGVAVGSSIQIALFITPLIVILGWIMDKEMTLYFTLFETVCLFVSTFIVNFLVLDGRSNYLEGALLCAAYVIISVAAFYYPDEQDASVWGA